MQTTEKCYDEQVEFAHLLISEGRVDEASFTLESLIKSQRDGLEPQIAGILFGKGK